MKWMCIPLCLLLLFCTFSESCICIAEPLISDRVPDRSFAANSVHGIHTPQQARLEGVSWCSSDSLTASSEHPWLQVDFGLDVNISIIQTGGYDGFFIFNYYLTSFRVYISDGTEGNLHPLKISDDSTQAIVFVRKGTYEVENSVLPSPVTTRVLRIVADEWRPPFQVCVRLEALGCIPSPECTTDPTSPSTSPTAAPTTDPAAPTTDPTAAPTTDPTAEPTTDPTAGPATSSTAASQGLASSTIPILAGVCSILVLLLGGTLAGVGVLVVYRWRKSRNNTQPPSSMTPHNAPLRPPFSAPPAECEVVGDVSKTGIYHNINDVSNTGICDNIDYLYDTEIYEHMHTPATTNTPDRQL